MQAKACTAKDDSTLDITYNTQRVDPVGLAVLLIAIVLILSPRRIYVYTGLVMLIAFLPGGQRIVIASLDFFFIRIGVLVGLMRCVLYQEFRLRSWTLVDTFVVAWVAWSTITQALILGTTSAAIARLGFGIDAAGMYFLARFLVKTREDAIDLVRVVAIFAIATAPFFLFESQTMRNVFSQLGGVPEYSMIRNGRLRCQGPFAHPIMAGVFWAMWLPTVIALAISYGRYKTWWILGVIAISFIVFTTASSTPAMGVILGVGCFCCFQLRRGLAIAVWTALGLGGMLHLLMQNGVHSLLARVNIVSGSTGWHRYHLMDEAINHVGEWFLIGTEGTGHWGRELQDVTNQFVLEAVRGGCLGLVFFSAVLFLVMRANAIMAINARDKVTAMLNWGFFSALFSMVFSFIGVSIFGSVISGYFLLQGAAISFAQASEERVASRARRKPRNNPPPRRPPGRYAGQTT